MFDDVSGVSLKGSMATSSEQTRKKNFHRAENSSNSNNLYQTSFEMCDESWVFDSLICFLHSPGWNAALNTFIEEKSFNFDPNIEIDLTNPVYIKIFEQYKNLVDFLLGTYMEEMNITPEQFEMACMEGKNLKALVKDETESDSHSFSFHRGLFQQIWAANDIRIFVNLMVKRNVELQLQALDLIEKRQNANQVNEKSEISEFDIDREEIEKVFEAEINENKQHQEDEAVDDKFKRLNLFFEKENHDTADVSQRKEYFYSQRDKILKARSEIRGRRLLDSLKKQDKMAENGRPTSSKAAQRVINGENDFDAPESAVQLRRTLAKKLRAEVVDQANAD